MNKVCQMQYTVRRQKSKGSEISLHVFSIYKVSAGDKKKVRFISFSDKDPISEGTVKKYC